MKQGPVDTSGRRRPVPIEDTEFDREVDSVIMAVGQTPENMVNAGYEVDGQGRVKVDEMTLKTSCQGVFAAGDVVTGPASVIEAIAAGREAARAIDRFLGGEGKIEEVLAPLEEGQIGGMLEEQEAQPRVEIPKRPTAERIADGGLVELGYIEEAAVAEAGRCLRCDLEAMLE